MPAMLRPMRSSLVTFLLALCVSAEAIEQTSWSLPTLKELEQSDAIGTGTTQLSPAEANIVRQITHRVTSACVADPGPGDPKTEDGIFKALRIRRIDLTPKGESALAIQGDGVCMCGAVGNCPFWLLSKGPNPKLLLKAIGIQSFAIVRSRSGPVPTLFSVAMIPQWKLASKGFVSTEVGIGAPSAPQSDGMTGAALGSIRLRSTQDLAPSQP